MDRRVRRRVYLIAAVALVCAAMAYIYAPARTPAGQPALADFDKVRFAQMFNDAASQIRVVAMLSPT